MKKLLLTFIVVVLTTIAQYSKAQVVVKAGDFPSMNQGGGYVTQRSPIIIAETNTSDFPITPGTVTYVITAPTNYEFLPNSGNFIPSGGCTSNCINISDFDAGFMNVTATTITITFRCFTSNYIDSLSIINLQVRALTGALVTGNILRTGGTAVQAGNSPANAQVHGILCSANNAIPIITYTPDAYYCNKENSNYTLTANPSGGTWTGSGVTGSNFNPFGVVSGTKKIKYTLITGTCYNADSINVVVKPSPTISLTSNDADNTICQGQSVTFTGTNTGGSKRFQFLVNNVPVTSLSTTSTYNTTALNNGDQITLISDNGNLTCPDTTAAITMTVITNPNPSVSISGLPSLVCSNTTGTFPITINPAGGTLTGNGVSGTNFSPSLAGSGNQIITYTITTSGCNFAGTTTVNVNSAPTVTLTSSDLDNIICEGDLITFTANTSGTANRYLFLKNSNGIQGPNATSTYAINTLANGDAISVTVDNGVNTCATNSSAIVTTVGKYPKAYFKWQNTCGTNDVTFVDTSKIVTGSITQWNWDFDINSSADVNSSIQNPSYTFSHDSSYYSRLIVTSNLGCKDTLTRRVTTLQGITITKSNPYLGDFNVSKSGWDFSDDSLTTWGWGAFNPNTLQHYQIVSAQKVWHTGSVDGYYNTNERSYLNSPCFNFQGLTKPMISIKMGMDTDYNTAGAILEISTNGGVSWNRIGNIGEGVDWYSNSGNDGRPGGYAKYSDNIVWSGHYDTSAAVNVFNGWKIAKIKLDSLSGLSSVRFRIAFGAANSGVTKYTGIAIDSVWIGDRNKLLVLENFTNTHIIPDQVGTPFLLAKNAVDHICDSRTKDVAPIYYHSSISLYNDPYNAYYSAGSSSRILYYGISTPPATVLDGNYYNGNVYSGGTAASRLDTTDVDSRILERAKFRIDLSTNIIPGNVSAKIKVIYIDPINSYNGYLYLHTVVIEDSASGDNSFSHVARQMLPDASGEGILKGSWTLNDSLTFSRTWSHNLSNPKLGVIAFLQNNSTKEILQSVYVKGTGNSGTPVILDVSDRIIENGSVLMFPNPANNEVNIVTIAENERIAGFALIDNLGRELKNETLNNGVRSIVLNTSDINNGLYYIRVTLANGITTLNKILINH
ncbi:MAG TPA: T9SS type A sorting domain-containing protein [Cytophagaceae bacterium]|jgi:hypothetical protein|nr:T9SS type A sorting domain-containing protein [Cytophagaceae bacterium]